MDRRSPAAFSEEFDPDTVRAEIAGKDADSARALLEQAGYSEEEIAQVLGS